MEIKILTDVNNRRVLAGMKKLNPGATITVEKGSDAMGKAVVYVDGQKVHDRHPVYEDYVDVCNRMTR